VIGSFRKHLADVFIARETFTRLGIEVTTPLGAQVLKPNIRFVRFDSDEKDLSDSAVQHLAVGRILGADAVYVVAPEGYIGRTTCYEVGRCMQASSPIYFSEQPQDLPIEVPASHVVNAQTLAAYILGGALVPILSLHDEQIAENERRLVAGEGSKR